ncbi:MAG: lysophospholipase [Silicimonas sp.]|nr:lysophospholipase [Silicimonas sp.]
MGRLILPLVLAYLTYGVVMVVLHPRFIYPFSDAGGLLPGFTETRLEAEDGTAIYVQEHAGPGPVLVYFMGNAGALPLFASAFERHIKAGRHVIAMEYRGGGGRPGTPGEDRLKSDALVVMDHAARLGKPLIVQGYSMGSGLATHVARERDVAGVILVAPFASMCRLMARRGWLPACQLPFVDHWRSLKGAAGITAPLLVLHGDQDRIIPVADSAGFADLPNGTRVVIEGANHSNLGGFPAFGTALEDFVAGL